MLDTAWQWITTSPPALPLWISVLSLLAGASPLLLGSRWWRLRLRLIATWVHETGHALAAIVLGRDVLGISINMDSSGVTRSIGRQHRVEQALVAFSGYPAPAALGSLLVFLSVSGNLHWAIFTLGLLPCLMLLLQRSLLGVFLTLIAAAVAFVLYLAPALPAGIAVACLAGYLCVASPQNILELHRLRTSVTRPGQEETHSDADTLAALTSLPPIIWEGIFMAVSLALPILALVLASR